MDNFDLIQLRARIKQLERQIAGESQPEPEPSATERIQQMKAESAENFEYENAIENENSEDPARRLTAKIQLALHERKNEEA
jgi:guanylate kinase